MLQLKRYLLFCVLIFVSKIDAQDIHFTQWNAISNFSNPAFTGSNNMDFNVALQYRSQWKQIGKPFNTVMIYYDKSIYWKKFRITPGLKFFNDVAAQNLKSNQIYLPFSTNFQFHGYELLGGIELGYVMKNLDYTKETFPNQFNWNKGSFDNELINNETLQNNFSYFDVNLGFGARRTIGKNKYTAGFSIYHLNSPKESFNYADVKLKRRYSIQLGFHRTLSNNNSIEANALVNLQNKANENVLTLVYNYTLSSNTVLFAGINNRYAFSNNYDAIAILAGLTEKKYRAGVSYDVTASKLNNQNGGRGGFEFFVIYSGLNTKPKKIKLECERL